MDQDGDRGGRAGQASDPWSGLAVRLAIGGAVTFGALASGFLVSRRGRRLVAETFRGTRRTPLAERVVDRFLDDPVLARRPLEAEEGGAGEIDLVGSVATPRERRAALALARSVAGVTVVGDHLVLDPSLRRRLDARRLSRSRR